MTYFKAVVTDKTASEYGSIVANTKSPSKYKGMSRSEFELATKYVTCYTIEIIEFN